MALYASRNKIPHSIGISFEKEGFGFAHVEWSAEDEPSLSLCQFRVISRRADYARALTETISIHGLEKSLVTCVLQANQYDLYLIEEPTVSPEELLTAVRWTVRDYLEYPIEEAVVDYIALPKPSQKITPMGYAVVVRQTIVDEMVNLVQSVGLRVMAIDIPELAMRNVVMRLKKSGAGLLFLRFSHTMAQLILLKNDTVHLARNIDIPLLELYNKNMINPDQLVPFQSLIIHEVQRSLEYCNTHLKEMAIDSIMVSHFVDNIEPLLLGLKEGTGFPSYALPLKEALPFITPISNTDQNWCLPAIGGALRREVSK